MAEEKRFPSPPFGMKAPSIPGAGNLFDPEVRGAIRDALHDALVDAIRMLLERLGHPVPKPEAAPPAEPPPAPPRAAPFPHGDVDLSFIHPNVPAPEAPRRGTAGRSYYFLQPPPASP